MSATPDTPSAHPAPSAGTTPAESAAPGATRRDVLRRAAAAGLLATPAVGLLGACATGGGDSGGTEQATGEKTAQNPLGVKEDAAAGGGDLQRWLRRQVRHRRAREAVQEPRSRRRRSSTSRPRRSPRCCSRGSPRGNPPEFVNNSGEKLLDFGALVADGQLQDLTELWDAPSVDDPNKKVRDTVMPGMVEQGIVQRQAVRPVLRLDRLRHLVLRASCSRTTAGPPPTTWEEFTALCEQIKAKGITPFGYAGANAAYYMWNVILTQAAKIGGAGGPQEHRQPGGRRLEGGRGHAGRRGVGGDRRASTRTRASRASSTPTCSCGRTSTSSPSTPAATGWRTSRRRTRRPASSTRSCRCRA